MKSRGTTDAIFIVRQMHVRYTLLHVGNLQMHDGDMFTTRVQTTDNFV